MAKEDKERALDVALAQIEKSFGKEASMKLGDRASRMKIETIPTGALSLDLALGVGGLPRGRVMEIYGPESSGKTTLMLHVIAEAQKKVKDHVNMKSRQPLDALGQKLGVVDEPKLLLDLRVSDVMPIIHRGRGKFF